MGITFRHDAAAVTPPSNQTTRKYGQNLVLQQNQQKYNQQQAGYDRLFALGRDNLQNQAQILRDNNQIVHQTNLAKGQQAFQLDRDKQQNEWQQQQQRGADFKAARARMDAHAKDALSNPDIPPELRNKIQSLINGKMAVLGSGFNETQQQEFLDQYNSQLAALLSEIPPKAPPPSAQDQFDQGIVTGPDGTQYRKNSKGDFEPLPQQPKRATSVDDVIRENPKALDSYLENEIKIETKGGEEQLTEPGLNAARERARKRLEQDLGLGTPTTAPEQPGAAPAAPAVPPEQRSILETPAELPPVPPQQGGLMDRLDEARKAPQDLTVQPPDQGTPPSPLSMTAGQQAAQAAQAADYHTQMTGQGYQLVTPPDGSRPYYYKDGTAGQGSSTMPTDPASVQNPWEGMASGGESQQAPTPAPAPTPAAPASSLPPAPEASSSAAPPAAPDFGKLTASAKNDADKAFYSQVQSIYQGQPPEVQSAISVLLNPDALPAEAAKAFDYLKSKGVDIDQLAEESSKTTREKTQDKMQEKYGSTWNSF